MSILDNLNTNESAAIEELRLRFQNSLSSEMYNDTIFFYRFLKARDFDIDQAENLLRKNIAWRKAFQMDNFLECFEPEEVFKKYASINFIGFDKEGNLVNYLPAGKIEARDVTKCFKINDLEKHIIWVVESDVRRINKENEKTGGRAYQKISILDLDCISFGNVTSKAATELAIRIMHLLQDNYPERMKSVYVINAPIYFTIIFSVFKRMMSNEMLQKIQVFGQNGWKEALQNVVDLDVLPAFLGGNRTDPDGNPLCETIMHFGGEIPPKYFLSPEDRTFKDESRVEKVHVSPSSSVKVLAEVQDLGSIIQCEFEVKSKDIGFGLFFQKSEDQLEDVLPIQKYLTVDGTETVSFKSQSIGTYIIIFDNSHSWFNSKEVHYCITIKNQDDL